MSAAPIASQLVLDLPREDVLHVLTVFDEECKRLSALMHDIAQTDDVTAFRRTAHALAGAAGAVGATVLEQAARAALAPEGLSTPAMAAVAAEIGVLAQAARDEAAGVVARLDKVSDQA